MLDDSTDTARARVGVLSVSFTRVLTGRGRWICRSNGFNPEIDYVRFFFTVGLAEQDCIPLVQGNQTKMVGSHCMLRNTNGTNVTGFRLIELFLCLARAAQDHEDSDEVRMVGS